MAFRIQDPVTSLFWEVDAGYRIRLCEKGSVYTHEEDGSIVNVDTGMPLRVAGNKIVEGDWASYWSIVDGVISIDDVHIAQYDETSSSIRVADAPASWVLIPTGAPVAAPEPVVVPEPVAVPEPEPEVEEEDVAVSEPEVEEDEDVPVARSAALIEEALNAQAAAADESEEEA
jgi:hypothetical protein